MAASEHIHSLGHQKSGVKRRRRREEKQRVFRDTKFFSQRRGIIHFFLFIESPD